MSTLVSDRIQAIQQKLPSTVRLIAVSKTISPTFIREAYAAGIRDFAENRLQEAIPKIDQLRELENIRWHFIGHIQTNKAKKVLQYFQWIHSVDSLKLAERLNQASDGLVEKPQLCLQVKMLPDPNKFGWEVTQLLSDLSTLIRLKNLNLQGLMTILPLGLTDEEKLTTFVSLNVLREKINQNYSLNLSQLSMGMSNDYEMAIQAGATMIRLGTIIFGARNNNP